MDTEEALNEFDERRDQLRDLGTGIEALVKSVLRARGLKVHSVDSRVKSKSSLRRKLGDKRGKYESLDDIHDLLGIRVITYFEDEVDAVAELVEQEFTVDPDNSIDRRATLDPDRFGYLSAHYVVMMREDRAGMPEYERFGDFKWEIQIRSVLQHAWAEIEHDLGYHTEGALPRILRRRFSRVAGLLEIADAEFTRLRGDAVAHRESIAGATSGELDDVFVDQDAIARLIETSEEIHVLDAKIAEIEDAEITPSDSAYAGDRAEELRALGLHTVGEVLRHLRENADAVARIGTVWLPEVPLIEAPAGVSLVYLAYFLAGSSGAEGATRYLQEQNYRHDDPEYAARLAKAAEELRG